MLFVKRIWDTGREGSHTSQAQAWNPAAHQHQLSGCASTVSRFILQTSPLWSRLREKKWCHRAVSQRFAGGKRRSVRREIALFINCHFLLQTAGQDISDVKLLFKSLAALSEVGQFRSLISRDYPSQMHNNLIQYLVLEQLFTYKNVQGLC